jgi:iron complex outermembrane receptor protein
MTSLVKTAALTATSAVALLGVPLSAQDAPGVENDSAVSTSTDAIVVTGFRGQPRTVTDSPVPVDVFSEELIQRSSQTDTLNVLQTLIPSFSVSRSANTTSNSFIRSPQLRGLSADKTLLLLNGRRRHKSGSVGVSGTGSQAADSAVIPALALRTIEVLRDGAAAQYGSDAIAGVINYGLKNDSEGGTLMVQAGQFYEGDGKGVLVAGNIGLPLTDNGFLNLTAQLNDDDRTIRGRTFTSTSWDPFVAYETDAAFREAVDAAGIDLNEPLEEVGKPEERAARFIANAGIDLNDTTSLYAFGNFSKSKGTAWATYRQPGGGHQVMDNPIRLEDGSQFRFRDMFPLGLKPYFSGEVTDWSGTVGWRTEREFANGHEFTADLAARYGWNKIEYSMTDTVNPSYGPDSPSFFRASDYTSDEMGLNADFTYSIPVDVFAGPLAFNFGGEFRREGFKIGAGEPASYSGGTWSVADPFDFCTDDADVSLRTLRANAPAGQGINCASASDPVYNILQPGSNGITGLPPEVAEKFTTESYSIYGEVTVDVIESLFLDIATRYEDYDSFGDKLVWKVASRLNITDWLALRGSVGTGFRAPTAGQLNMTQQQINTVGGVPLNFVLYPAMHPVSQYLGAVPLRPETSKNYSVGITLSPADGLSITIDAYRIDLRDQVYSTSEIVVTPAIEAAMTAAGIEGAGTIDRITFFQNAFDSRTEGLDIVASYRAFLLGDEPTNFTAAFNTNSYKIKQVNIPSVTFNEVSRYNFENSSPEWRANVSAIHDFGPVTALVRGNLFGPWSRQTTRAGNAIQDYKSEVMIDVELSAPLGDGYELTLGARNLLDNYPAVNVIDNTNGRTFVDGPVDWQGGYYYARLNYQF